MEGFLVLIALGAPIFLIVGCIQGFRGYRRAGEALARIDELQFRLMGRESGESPLAERKRFRRMWQEAHSASLISGAPPVKAEKRTTTPVSDSYAAKVSAPLTQVQAPKPAPVEKVDEVPVFSDEATEDVQAVSSPASQPAAPVRRVVEVSTEPSLWDHAKEKFAKQLPDTENMNWETLVWTYIVPRLGVLVFSVAVFIMMTYLSSQGTPALRVAMGYVVAAGLLGAGWKFEKTYAAYARVLYAGGLAVAYFVTFATHFIPYAKIFENPGPSLAGMGAIVGIWAFIAERRKSPVVAMLVTALGHFTIALSTFSLEDPATYSTLGILILSAGSAFFLLKNRWYYVASVGMVASYANHFFLMARSDAPDTVPVFAMGMSVLAAYYVIYAVAEAFSAEHVRREKVPTWFRTGFATVNTAFLLGLGTLLMDGFSFTEDYQYVFRYIFGAGVLALALVYLAVRGRDPLYNLYFTKATAIVTLGLADQFSGTTLTTWLAVEMVALLVSARRSGLLVTLLLAQGVAALAFMHGLYSIAEMSAMAYADDGYRMMAVQAALAVAGFLGASVLFQKTDWAQHIRVYAKLRYGAQVGLWQWGMAAKPEDAPDDLKAPLEGLLIPYATALAGATLAVGYVARLVNVEHGYLATAVATAILLGLALAAKSKPLGLVTLLWFGVTWLTGMYDMLKLESVGLAAAALGISVLPVLATEKRYAGAREGWTHLQAPATPYVLYAAWSAMAGLFVLGWLDAVTDTAVMLGLAATLYAGSWVLHRDALRIGAMGVFLWAAYVWHIDYGVLHGATPMFNARTDLIRENTTFMHGLIVAATLLAVAVERLTSGDRLKPLGWVVFVVAWGSVMRAAHFETTDAWTGSWWILVSAAYLSYGLGLRSKAAIGLAAVSTVMVSGYQTIVAYDQTLEMWPLCLGLLGATALWVTWERLLDRAGDALSDGVRNGLTPVCVSAATFLMLVLAERVPALSDSYLTLSWSALGVGLFGMAVATRQAWYRYSALVVLGLATVRVVLVDTRELEVLYRAAAWGGLGLVLLGLALLYFKLFVKPDQAVVEEENEPEV